MPNGCRKKVIGYLFKTMAYIFVFTAGVFSRKSDVDFDYSFYLGPDYKKGYKQIKSVSTYVSNHVSWIDTMTLYKYF